MDGAAMFEDNLPTEAKTDAGAGGLGGVEGDKGVLQYVGWHTTSVVADEKPHPRPTPDPSPRRGENCVLTSTSVAPLSNAFLIRLMRTCSI